MPNTVKEEIEPGGGRERAHGGRVPVGRGPQRARGCGARGGPGGLGRSGAQAHPPEPPTIGHCAQLRTQLWVPPRPSAGPAATRSPGTPACMRERLKVRGELSSEPRAVAAQP